MTAITHECPVCGATVVGGGRYCHAAADRLEARGSGRDCWRQDDAAIVRRIIRAARFVAHGWKSGRIVVEEEDRRLSLSMDSLVNSLEGYGDRIAPRPVPGPLWGHNACKLLGRFSDEWRAIRADVAEKTEWVCEVCGAHQDKGMVCDEVWRYDLPDLDDSTVPWEVAPTEQATAVLVALRLLCPPCDSVTHLGFTQHEGGQEAVEEAIGHMARVNGQHVEQARITAGFAKMRARWPSTFRYWKVTVEPDLAEQYSALRIVEAEIGKATP